MNVSIKMCPGYKPYLVNVPVHKVILGPSQYKDTILKVYEFLL